VVIELEQTVAIKTGQCMRWEAMLPDKKGGRLFSMANAGGDAVREMTFTFRIMPDGMVSSCIPNLKVGDTVQVSGPFGKFIFDGSDTRDIVLVAGGTGISVLRAIYQHALTKGMKNSVHLLFSVLNIDEVIYKQELEELAKTYPQFSTTILYTEAPPEKKVHRGLISEALFDEEFGPKGYQQTFYICGPPPFIEAAEKILKEKGVTEDRIHIDRWKFYAPALTK
jgi:ferredoxin-NADP reductase